MSTTRQKNTGRGIVRTLRRLLLLALPLGIAGPYLYRAQTEKTVEARIEKLSHWSGSAGYMVKTDKGVFDNSSNFLDQRPKEDVETMQSRFEVGRGYKLTYYGGFFRRQPVLLAAEPLGVAVPSLTGIFFTKVVNPVDTVPDKGRFINDEKGEGFSLTYNEIALVKSIFGETFTTSYIRLHFNNGYHPRARAVAGTEFTPDSTIERQKIVFLGRAYAAHDYTMEDAASFGIFVHEMAHNWQLQTGDAFTKATHRKYAYVLTPDSRFTDYGREQQATIIEDYAVRFLHRSHLNVRRTVDGKWLTLIDRNGVEIPLPTDPVKDTQLIRVVEEQFPSARELRLKVERAESVNPGDNAVGLKGIS